MNQSLPTETPCHPRLVDRDDSAPYLRPSGAPSRALPAVQGHEGSAAYGERSDGKGYRNGGSIVTLRQAKVIWLGFLCLLCGVGMATHASAAEPPYEYNASLSLTGGCTVSTIDPIPDPGCPGPSHPPKSFSKPTAVTIDSYGNEYVASYGTGGTPEGSEGRIDVFDPEGNFITQIAYPYGPQSLAVDSDGNLYVTGHRPGNPDEFARLSPIEYEPEVDKIKYGARVVIDASSDTPKNSVAVDLSNDHVYVSHGNAIAEYGSLDEANKLLATIAHPRLGGYWLAVDAQRRRLYASSCPEVITDCWVLVFNADAPHELLEEVTGGETPFGEFASNKGWTSIAVNETTGGFFVEDLEIEGRRRIYQFDENYKYVSALQFGFIGGDALQIAVSNAEGATNHELLYVPSHPGGVGHAFAFEPPGEIAPEVESVSVGNIGETEAELRARIEPNGGVTSYVFEYITEQAFDEAGGSFTGAQVAGKGTLAASAQGAEIFAPATGLSPGTSYRFRVVVENAAGSDEDQGGFITYPDASVTPACPNQALRTAFSASLPDCRAYELVTPPDTNGRAPKGIGFVGDGFTTLEASPAGNAVSFVTEGGSLPGTEGAGGLNGDLYRSTRGPSGWTSGSAGPSGAESTSPGPGSTSPDQGYAFWTASQEGSAVIDGESSHYVRYPDGHSALVGRGELGVDPKALGRLITEGGTHIVFETFAINGKQPVQLEPDAPPTGTKAVYDRTADEVTHVVSLLPGNETPAAGEHAAYIGASTDGAGIAFSIGSTLYLRVNNATTFKIGESLTFAGVSQGGKRIFYVKAGDLYAFDTEAEEEIRFTSTGNAIVVNVAPQGSRAYFVSISVIAGAGANPNGEFAKEGKQNLYLSEEGQVRFVATVTPRDVEGELRPDGLVDGLGLWTSALKLRALATDPSRLNSDGTVLLFQSQANLDGYDSGGFAQIYRYDSNAERLHCVSCIPTKEPATGGASLQSIAPTQDSPEPFSYFGFVPNLRSDGKRAFFQSTEALVSTDNNGVQDVYEWEEAGVGSCNRPGGCVYLISSGHSADDNYLYGVSQSGDDVFFITTDVLTGFDAGDTPSIYDARVGGGFPEPGGAEPCVGEGCRPSATPAPSLSAPAKPAVGAKDNVRKKRCPKGKRKVKRNGKVRCVKKKHRKAGARRGAAK